MSEYLSYDGYALVFEDDFNGETLDRTKWNVELHDPGWVNEELQAYVDAEDVLSLRDGFLHIRPTRLALGDGSVFYRSGRISTQGKHEFTYGIFEARLKVPRGKRVSPGLLADDGGRGALGPVARLRRDRHL
nr:hypothetical protein [uncultured Oscillibacter sp.]